MFLLCARKIDLVISGHNFDFPENKFNTFHGTYRLLKALSGLHLTVLSLSVATVLA